MKIGSCIKMGLKIIKGLLIIGVVITMIHSNVSKEKIFKVENFNLNRKFGVSAIIEKEEEEKPIENITTYEVLSTFSGDLTGYSADCPLCNGTLACMPSYKVYKNNVVTYNDSSYGNVRIVASSKQLACGSIVRINSKISDEPILAIVLDRGVINKNLDLLVPSESYAYKYVGRSHVSYDVLRYGW